MIKGVNEYQFSELKKGSMVPQYLLKECVFVCGGGDKKHLSDEGVQFNSTANYSLLNHQKSKKSTSLLSSFNKKTPKIL